MEHHKEAILDQVVDREDHGSVHHTVAVLNQVRVPILVQVDSSFFDFINYLDTYERILNKLILQIS